MFITIHWGTTATRRNILSNEVSLEVGTWLSTIQRKKLEKLAKKYNISEYRIIRGAFHDSITRLMPVMENLGKDREAEYINILTEIAEAIGWYYSIIDGAKAITMNRPTGSTWDRWKKNNPSSHLRESAKKNWDKYHTYLGDLDEVGEWYDSKFRPEEWKKNKSE